jgi:hypothetical protein
MNTSRQLNHHMINTDQTKEHIRSLPEDIQDSLASLALSQLKNRARLESIAEASIRQRLWWFLPFVFPLLMLGMGRDSFPILIASLFSLIAVGIAYLHRRIDAIYRLMKDDRDTLAARINQAEQATPSIGDKPSN